MNEAQEQQLQTDAGVWRLPQPAFAHGQIHVALLNSGVPKNTKILMEQIAGKQGTFEAYILGGIIKNILDLKFKAML